MQIGIQKNKVNYLKEKNTFIVSGKGVQFGTEHSILNEKTGVSKTFKFSHSTGSEWDPNTVWVYKSEEGLVLHVTNDDVTPEQARNYLKAKTGYL